MVEATGNEPSHLSASSCTCFAKIGCVVCTQGVENACQLWVVDYACKVHNKKEVYVSAHQQKLARFVDKFLTLPQ